MSDLFHRDLSDEFIHQVFDVMVAANWHIFQIVTKRSRRLLELARTLPWPGNVWVGVSVESEYYAWRVDHLRQVPAKVRFVSAEPLLGPLDKMDLTGIHWVITGGESGAGFRTCDPKWVRAIRDRCAGQNIAFFHKQWGGRTPKSNGRVLDGRTWDEFPTDPKEHEYGKQQQGLVLDLLR